MGSLRDGRPWRDGARVSRGTSVTITREKWRERERERDSSISYRSPMHVCTWVCWAVLEVGLGDSVVQSWVVVGRVQAWRV